MTVPEFLDIFEELSGRFDWTLTADTGRYAERRTNARFHLRGSPKSYPSETLDPLQAVAFARTGDLPDTWAEAGIHLEMKLPDASAIAAAASDRTWTREEGRRVPAPELLEIRQRLLAAVGLIPRSRGQAGSEPTAAEEAGISTAEFLRLLVSVRDRFDWTLTADTGHFLERRATPRFRLEAISKSMPDYRLDPVRALAYAQTGELADTWLDAAVLLLGMATADAQEVVAAAGDRTWVGPEGERAPSPQRLRLRELLLQAVGVILPVAGEEVIGP